MNVTLPVQYSARVDLWNSLIYRDVLVCFTPVLRAGESITWRQSYIKFIFTPRNGGREDEFSFMPSGRWTSDIADEWNQVLTLLPASFNVEFMFEQVTADLAL